MHHAGCHFICRIFHAGLAFHGGTIGRFGTPVKTRREWRKKTRSKLSRHRVPLWTSAIERGIGRSETRRGEKSNAFLQSLRKEAAGRVSQLSSTFRRRTRGGCLGRVEGGGTLPFWQEGRQHSTRGAFTDRIRRNSLEGKVGAKTQYLCEVLRMPLPRFAHLPHLSWGGEACARAPTHFSTSTAPLQSTGWQHKTRADCITVTSSSRKAR